MRFICSKKTPAYIACLILFSFLLQGYGQESFLTAAMNLTYLIVLL